MNNIIRVNKKKKLNIIKESNEGTPLQLSDRLIKETLKDSPYL